MVAHPRPDRWHRSSIALLGGVAFFLAFLGGKLLADDSVRHETAVMIGCGLMFAVGLIDDFRRLSPLSKLAGQLVAAIVVMQDGLIWSGSPWPPVNAAITLLWIVGITNAFNLLDNMDGLSAGIAVIAAAFFAFHFNQLKLLGERTELLIFAAALVGFLVYNFFPASIFMGDGGALFIGFFLASMGLRFASAEGDGGLSWFSASALVLCVPILDTTFVSATRRLSGRPISQGGRDHLSHRLVALGLRDPVAVVILYALGVLGGFVSMGVSAIE
jgi:UDP-GlcNAc:undecaprenyl-phosphate GlcNAc-1-phosphate transferase